MPGSEQLWGSREADDLLRAKDQAIDASLNAMAITDADGRNIYVNPAFLRMWGYDDPAEILGRLPMDFFDGSAAVAVLQEMRHTGRWEGELVAKRRDGSRFDVVLSATTIHDAEGRVVNMVASFIDLSEQKALQAKFLQAQKMESVGRLAGGVAHDFNNLLTVIRGYVELSMHSVPSDGVLYRRLMQVQKAAESATMLTRQLLAFSRKEIIDPQVLDLNDVLRRIQSMLPRLIGEDVHVVLDMSDGLWPVRFDPGQCDQVLINLAVNARDAMPDGGVLTLSTANVRLERQVSRHGVDVAPGDYVALTVRDTGVGITAEVMGHLFEPFFTTKAAGRGTGLGLAMVYGAVSQNGGTIDVDSAPGHGATFRILLPRVMAVDEMPAPSFSDAPGGLETVILVEDDDDVRSLAELALRHQGYEVWVCGNGHEAIERVKAAGDPPHLLVTDVIMPDMNGRVVAEQLVALCPTLRVLYTSGYPHDVIASHGVIAEGIEFLPKPYTVASLARKVRDVLDAPAR